MRKIFYILRVKCEHESESRRNDTGLSASYLHNMIKQFKYNNITWIDLSSPTPDEIASVAKDYNIHPVAASELGDPSQRAKVDLYDEFIYLVLHFPNHRNSLEFEPNDRETQEMDFIIGKNFLVTTSYETMETMEEFGKIIETNAALSKSRKEIHAGFLFYHIVKNLYRSLERNLEFINYNLKKAEAKIFSGNEKEMVLVLATINKRLLDFRGTLKAHSGVLASLEAAGKSFFNEKFQFHLKSIISEYKKVWNNLESSRELFNELRQTNESLLQIKTNEVTKNFTMLAFITFPLTLLVTIFTLRADGTPLVDLEYGFWYISALIVALILLILAYYKHKRWM